MEFSYIEPDVAISVGKETIMDTTVHPPNVGKLHVVLEGWFGDHLIETFPCFVFTKELSEAIVAYKLTGVVFSRLKLTKGDFFDTSFPDVELPDFLWGKISGKTNTDDFFIGEDLRLVVSSKALKLLREFGIPRAIIEHYS